MKFDFMFKNFIQSMMGRVVDVDKWSHITNALKRGGLGLCTGSHILAEFYLPSIYATDDILPRLLHPRILEWGLPEINRRKEEAIIDYNSRVQIKYMIIDFDRKIHTTTYLCGKIELNIMNNHINTVNDRDRAHYISQLNRNSNSNLLLPMGKWNEIRFTNVEMRAIFYRKLGLKLIISKELCINCGDHGAICKYGKGIIYRHDVLVRGFSKLMKGGNIIHTIEPRNLLDGTHMKPADINSYISADGKMTALDIGITSCTKSSTLHIAKNRKLHCANELYTHKINKYNKYIKDKNININRIKYQPIILEDTGAMHKETVKLIKFIGEMRASAQNIDKSLSISYCFQYLTAILQKANVCALLNHYNIF